MGYTKYLYGVIYIVIIKKQKKKIKEMKEVFRANDPVLISWAIAMLKGANIDALEFDQHTSVLEGSIGAIQRRIMVAEDDYNQARRIIIEAGEGHQLPEEKK